MPKVSGEDVTNAGAGPNEPGYMPQLHENDDEVSVSDEEPVDEEDLEPETDDSDGQETVTLNLK